MTNINTLYPSNYLKAADLNGATARVTIRNVVVEKIGTDTKPVLYFQGKEKGMVLNKTNANTIAMLFGPETDGWSGGQIEIFSAYVDFQGRQVEALRVRAPQRVTPPRNGARQPQQQHPQYDNGFDDTPPQGQPVKQTLAQELDDEIPF